MRTPPFSVDLELPGWTLYWASLEELPHEEDRLEELRQSLGDRVRGEYGPSTLTSLPAVAGVRRLFRAAGCDPTRYRPSSEALLRRLLRGGEIPAIHPLVDLNNCLSVELAVPCCVIAGGTLAPPLRLRAGGKGESFESLRGTFSLGGKPVLSDSRGPFGTPITDSRRVKITPETRRAWLVAYLPAEVVEPEAAQDRLEELLAAAPTARLELGAASRGA